MAIRPLQRKRVAATFPTVFLSFFAAFLNGSPRNDDDQRPGKRIHRIEDESRKGKEA